ncbi:hypothetical protein Dvina_37685 [Dactylosporangium vinaceum]|uniref:DUF6039 family protein n=1 Tax=Dactylosporangium vinaceum TaxID=53362 RepID=A0ABV5MKP3_9ACTN|nr:DUF6039 family protein [Dactylosporangium vinaceum]UAB93891.1 hypothetical protein Dvina_37685 [Dactylosporangium vinaceum]
MTDSMTAERRAQIVPPAQHQVEAGAAGLLHSANAGVIVQKVGQLRSEYRNEGRVFAREMAKHVNARQAGNATAFVYEETFGYEDRLHFLIHLRSLDTYYGMVEMGDQDRAYRESVAKERVQTDSGAGAWDRLFVDGSMRSNVLLPHTWTGRTGRDTVPVAGEQTAQPEGQLLHSGNAGIVLLRSATVGYGFRAEARQIARELVENINKNFAGEASAFAYEEAFGGDQLHWLIHLRDLTTYQRLLEQDAFADDGRPGTFVDGSVSDIALTPHHWGLYATRQQA